MAAKIMDIKGGNDNGSKNNGNGRRSFMIPLDVSRRGKNQEDPKDDVVYVEIIFSPTSKTEIPEIFAVRGEDEGTAVPRTPDKMLDMRGDLLVPLKGGRMQNVDLSALIPGLLNEAVGGYVHSGGDQVKVSDGRRKATATFLTNLVAREPQKIWIEKQSSEEAWFRKMLSTKVGAVNIYRNPRVDGGSLVEDSNSINVSVAALQPGKAEWRAYLKVKNGCRYLVFDPVAA